MKNANYWISRYQQIWDEYRDLEDVNITSGKSEVRLLERSFLFQFDEEVSNPDIVFMGINPSFSGENEPDDSFQNSYSKPPVDGPPYFRTFHKVEKKLEAQFEKECSWTHIDTLVFRETQQKFIKKLLKKKSKGNDFIYDQLMVSKELLEYYNPKILVVSNTMARELLGKNRGVYKDSDIEYGVWMGLKFKFDKALGTHRIVDSGILDGTIVFFTSMLSGQRALDLGSRERLVWHINHALNFLSE